MGLKLTREGLSSKKANGKEGNIGNKEGRLQISQLPTVGTVDCNLEKMIKNNPIIIKSLPAL